MYKFILSILLLFSFSFSFASIDSYKIARQKLFGILHNTNGVITDVYCGRKYDHTHGVCPTCIPNHEVINCEHTWPQSKFSGRESKMMKIDLHHLYPANSQANSARGNLPFGDVDGSVICGDSKRGKIKGTNIIGFEPPENHKGNVARAMFYFSKRYKLPIDSIQESYFRKWDKLDPIDREEHERNLAIKELQGWTNPFIDDPNLIDTLENFR